MGNMRWLALLIVLSAVPLLTGCDLGLDGLSTEDEEEDEWERSYYDPTEEELKAKDRTTVGIRR